MWGVYFFIQSSEIIPVNSARRNSLQKLFSCFINYLFLACSSMASRAIRDRGHILSQYFIGNEGRLCYTQSFPWLKADHRNPDWIIRDEILEAQHRGSIFSLASGKRSDIHFCPNPPIIRRSSFGDLNTHKKRKILDKSSF